MSGHVPQLVIGQLEGRRVAVFGGRSHYYESGRADAMRLPLETLAALGTDKLILTNAAGSLRPDIPPGDLMLLDDHIAFAGTNPLIGEPTDARFVHMTDAHDARLRAALTQAAQDEAVGMSTVPEIILARFLGLRCAAISVITNMGAGLSDESISHDHTKAMAPLGAAKLERILRRFLRDA